MQDARRAFHPPLRASHIADLRLAAAKMTGPKRRAFEAEMPLTYCGGTPLVAANTVGWGRRTVALGLAERRTGRIGVGAPSAFSGRTRWADQPPQEAEALRQRAASQAQQAPTCRTPLASTRLTAQAARDALRARGEAAAPWPSRSTMAAGLHRLGFRLRQVVKATPHKPRAETDALFDHREKKTKKRRQRTPAKA